MSDWGHKELWWGIYKGFHTIYDGVRNISQCSIYLFQELRVVSLYHSGTLGHGISLYHYGTLGHGISLYHYGTLGHGISLYHYGTLGHGISLYHEEHLDTGLHCIYGGINKHTLYLTAFSY